MKRTLFLLFFLATTINSFAQSDLTALIDKCSPAIFKITTYDASGNEYAVGTGFLFHQLALRLAITMYFKVQQKQKLKLQIIKLIS